MKLYSKYSSTIRYLIKIHGFTPRWFQFKKKKKLQTKRDFYNNVEKELQKEIDKLAEIYKRESRYINRTNFNQ